MNLSSRCMIKIDLIKAYESVEWSFILDMLRSLGFIALFINRVQECISTVSYSVLINGKPTKPLQAKKGLRHRDPLSSFLFALGMYYVVPIKVLSITR